MSEITPALYHAGEGEPIVLIHGFTGTWHHWRPLLGDLVARYEVFAPTLAGHSGGPPFPYSGQLTIENAADSLEHHLDELGLQSAHLIGNSLGGALAIALAKRGRARSVVALSPGGGWELGSPETERIRKFFARQIKLTRAAQSQLPRVMARGGARRLALRDAMRYGHHMQPADAVDLARESIRCSVIDDVLTALGNGDATALRGLDEVTAPVLLAWAEHDRILPMETCAPRFRRDIPGVEFRVLPGVGHVPMWDDTRLVLDTICGWVNQHTTAPQPAAAS